MQIKEILNLNPIEFYNYLEKELSLDIPEDILDVNFLQNSGDMLLKISSLYSYACNLCSLVKIETRDAKRNKTKAEYEDMVDKKEIISNFCDALKQKYNALSRAVTIKMEINNELKMLGEL